MTPTRVYSMKVIHTLFHDAELHGRFTDILKREGIERIVVGGAVYYPADPVDEFLRMVKL